jgi:hypothetical protein
MQKEINLRLKVIAQLVNAEITRPDVMIRDLTVAGDRTVVLPIKFGVNHHIEPTND